MKLGTRGSALALAQATAVATLLSPLVGQVEIVPIKTSGDLGDRERLGAFVSEIEEALLREEVDVGLHCLKDLPTRPIPGLVFGAYLRREDARDAMLTTGKRFAELPEGAVVGTGSLRRTSQLAAHGRAFQFKPLLGNVDTRLSKLQRGEYDAIVLAVAGLKRLGLEHPSGDPRYQDIVSFPLDVGLMVPAAGQGTLALKMREGDALRSTVRALNDETTEWCSIAERAFLAHFGGGCSVPVAAYAEVSDGEWRLRGLIASPDGLFSFRGETTFKPESAQSDAVRLAEKLGAEGGFEILERLARR